MGSVSLKAIGTAIEAGATMITAGIAIATAMGIGTGIEIGTTIVGRRQPYGKGRPA
jgi:hypothetical protein